MSEALIHGQAVLPFRRSEAKSSLRIFARGYFSALTDSVIEGNYRRMSKGFSVIIETFTAALVLAVRYQIIRQGKRTPRMLR